MKIHLSVLLISFLELVNLKLVFARELVVDSDKGPYFSIASALKRAHDGDLLTIKSGIYRETITISRTVGLKGAAGATIDGEGKGHVVRIEAPGVKIEGLRVIHSGMDLERSDAAIFIAKRANGTTLERIVIESSLFGIWVEGANQTTVSGSRIIGDSELISQKRGNGIQLWNSKGNVIRDNEISFVRDGIYVFATSQSEIRKNKMVSVRFGIHYMHSDSNDIEENRVTQSRVGLALMFSKELNVKGNVAIENEEDGILFRDLRSSRVVDNVLMKNSKGLFLYNSQFNEIQGNLIGGNAIGAHVWAGSSDNKVLSNSFIHNQEQVKFMGDSDQMWCSEGRGNYWSNYVGMDLNQDRIGDIPYRSNNVVDRLIWSYPVVRLLTHSPSFQLLKVMEKELPVIGVPAIVDDFPEMVPFHKGWTTYF